MCSVKLPVVLIILVLSTFLLTYNFGIFDSQKQSKELSSNILQKNPHAYDVFSHIAVKLTGTLVNMNNVNAYAESLNYTSTELPYLLEHVNSLQNGGVYVQDGLILLDKSESTDLQLEPWGPINTLELEKISKFDSDFYMISGTSGNDSSGFASKNLNYQGDHVSLLVGSINKSRESQAAFSIGVTGKNGNYFIIFVNGPLSIRGWHDNNYYEQINPNSSKLVDLKSLIALKNDEYSSVNKISIILQKNVTTLLEFRIDLNRTTENTPTLLPSENSYYVVGDIRRYSEGSLQQSIVFHDLKFLKITNISYLSAGDYRIVENQWNIIKNNTLNDGKSDLSTVILTAEKPISSQEFFQDIFSVDVSKSISDLGDKDILLSCVLAGLIVLFLGWRFFWSDKNDANKND